MPRPRKMDIEKQTKIIQEIDEKIEKHKAAIATLREEKKLAEEKLQADKMNQVMLLMKEKNLTVDELRNLIDAKE